MVQKIHPFEYILIQNFQTPYKIGSQAMTVTTKKLFHLMVHFNLLDTDIQA